MSDFFLDLRPIGARTTASASKFLRFFDDTKVFSFSEPSFSLVVTRSDDSDVWAPAVSTNGNLLVALAGRVAFTGEEWENTKRVAASGGLACRAIIGIYQQGGTEALRALNGNYTIILHDKSSKEILIVTDRCGAAPSFRATEFMKEPVVSSHPDLLAASIEKRSEIDNTSLAEFLSTGKVSFPFTYYKSVEALNSGSIHSILTSLSTPPKIISTQHFHWEFEASEYSEDELVDQLGCAFRNAVRRRSLSIFGTTAVAASGGLDSRLILACCPKSGVKAFTFFDEENTEYRTAKSISKELGIEIIPFKRDFDHYGKSAELAIRIYGGMGAFVNNHFLAFRKPLLDLGITNILTGFYCDYLFKGLAQNRRKNRLLQTDSFAPYRDQWYRPIQWFDTTAGHKAKDRLAKLIPENLRSLKTDSERMRLEASRIFPLMYEPDNAESTVPQRVMPWFLPIVDNEVVEVYRRIPSGLKLNATLYSKMVAQVCGPEISKIPDSNTGAPVNASLPRTWISLAAKAATRRVSNHFHPKLATNGSWPNWSYYASHSPVIRELWSREQSNCRDLFSELLGYDPFTRPVSEWGARNVELFFRILTLKLWFESRN